jgi:hypothetical protein
LPILSQHWRPKMARKPEQPALAVVATPPPPKADRALGEHGQALWDQVTNEYLIEDAGGREILLGICQALDRAEALKVVIDRDGPVITTQAGGVRDHPLLRHELQNRAFIAKSLRMLGLDVEPVRPGVGRPSRGPGIDRRSLEKLRGGSR